MTTAIIGRLKSPSTRALLSAASYLLELAVIAASYFGLANVALLLPAANPAATPLWPPTGIALCLVLLCGYRVWPAIFLGAFSASAFSVYGMTMASLPEAASAGLATAAAASAGAWLINRWSNGRKTFDTPLGIAKCMAIVVVTALISSAIAWWGGRLAHDVAPNIAQGVTHGVAPVDLIAGSIVPWITWWLADAAGTAILTSAILLWANAPLHQISKLGSLESVIVILVAGVVGAIAGGAPIGNYLPALLPYREAFGFLIFVPLVWAALRGNQRDAAAAVLVFCGTAIWSVSAGSGALPAADLHRSLVLLPALSIAALIISLMLAATAATQRQAQTALVATQSHLTSQLHQTQLAFRNLKQHFQIFIEGAADYAIFVLDPTGHVTSWNGNAHKIIGYEADEILGKHFAILYRPDERRAGVPNRALELAVRHGKNEVEGWRVRKNGAPFFVTGALTAIRDDHDNLIGFANVLRDATERRDTQEKLVEAREQLAMSQKMEAIGKLTGGIAHDFNNLLMIIGGNAQTFKRLLDPKLPRAIEAIQTAAKRGESLTRQLLTFSRRQHLSPTVVDLSASVRNMRTLIESSLRGNIVYKEQIEAGIDRVKIDLAELELAIVNIAVNARDAMPNGGVFSLTVCNVKADGSVGTDQSENFVALEFSDTGMGIPPSLLTRIFDPFFTTKEVGKGTGLGLSQVYGFAHQAGGTVQADSTVGQGTTITIYLPASTESAAVEIATANDDTAGERHPVVLVVDDSVEVAEVTSSLFEHLGYETVYRESADEALKLLAEGASVDLVFSDIVMPGTIDGVGLAHEVRSRYPGLPVMLTTGYSAAAAAAPSGLRILPKPFDSDTLRSFIQDTMESGALAH
jgi:PAS domain S-box-containing protein